MVRFASVFTIVALVASGFCTPMKRTASQIKQDISTLNVRASQMGASIDAFVTPDVPAALAVHAANVQLDEYLNQATAHAQATSKLTLAEAQDIVNHFKENSDINARVQASLRAKVKLVQALPLNGAVALVNKDVTATGKASSKYVDALKAIISDKDQINVLVALETKGAAEFTQTAALFT